MMKNLAATAETNNIPIGKLFEDLSSSSEEVTTFGGENLENIKRGNRWKLVEWVLTYQPQ